MSNLTPDEHEQIEQFIRRTNPRGVPVVGGTPASASLSGERRRVPAVNASLSGERLRPHVGSASVSGVRHTPLTPPAVTPLRPAVSTRAIAAWASAIVLAIVAWTLAPAAPIREPVPDAMLTPWHSAHPDYQRATLAFSPTHVILGPQAPDGARAARPHEHRIVSLQRRKTGDSTVVALTYDTDDGPMELQAILVEQATPRLVFRRPHGLTWERGETSSAGADSMTPSRPSLQP